MKRSRGLTTVTKFARYSDLRLSVLFNFRHFSCLQNQMHYIRLGHLDSLHSVYTSLLKIDDETSISTYVNHAPIRYWNKPVLSNDGMISHTMKQWDSLMGFELTPCIPRIRCSNQATSHTLHLTDSLPIYKTKNEMCMYCGNVFVLSGNTYLVKDFHL